MLSSDSGRITLRDCLQGSEALQTLLRDFDAGRMAPATLFTGESGIGKKTAAHLLAKGLLCTGEGDKPCGSCRNCRRYDARTHPNALFPAPLPREKTIKVDALRQTIDALSRHALETGKRVIVIENAERMTPQAQNCLLKTLEESPEDTFFFLTADVESAILPTVRSRCRCVRMQPWTEERVLRALESRGIERSRALALARYCEGSLGRALSMQEDESYWEARELVRRSFLAVRSPGDVCRCAQLIKDQKDSGDRLLTILEQEIRACLHDTLTGAPPDRELPPHFQSATPRSLMIILESIITARKQKASNVVWAALSEGLMQTISEEASTWQQ